MDKTCDSRKWLLVALALLVQADAIAERTTTYTRTAAGLIETIDGPRVDVSDVTTYAYDASGNRITETNALGHVTRFTQHDGAGRVLTRIDPNGSETRYTYHPRGWLTSVSVDGATTQFNYDPVGNLVGVIAPDGATVQYTYDPANRLTEITDSLGNRIVYTLDNAGNRTAEEVFDGAGALRHRLTRIFNTLGQVDQLQDANGQATAFAYDPNGNPIATTDALTRPSSQSFDPLDRVSSQTDPANGVTRYTYDANDNVTSVTDPNGAVTTYTYNGFGERTSQTSPDTGVTTYTYDSAGNLASKTDARGITVTYVYDALNRLIAVSYPDTTLNVAYEYDQGPHGIGRLTTLRDAGGVVTYGYDSRGNLIEQTRDTGSLQTTLRYHYDLVGRLTGIVYPSGRLVDYVYDLSGQVTSVRLTDANGTRILADNVQHLPFGPVQAMTYGNGLLLTRTFDQNYQLTGQQIPGVLNASYSHDPVGNIRTWADQLDAMRGQGFDYDVLDRLTSATGPIAAFSYDYDPVGNRVSERIGTSLETYTYTPNSNRLERIDGALTDLLETDAAGNITRSIRGDFTYSAANRLASYTTGTTTAAYVYNGNGERIQKTVDGVDTHFRYGLQGELLAEVDASGEAIREYVYLNGQPLATLAAVESAAGVLLQKASTDHNWLTVDLGAHGETPVVIAGPPTFNGNQAGVVSLRNITAGSADVAFREWNYLDGAHLIEDISVLAMPPGRYPQADGSIWEIGRFSLDGTRAWKSVPFQAAFPKAPRVFVTAQTSTAADTMTVRVNSVSIGGFRAALFEQDSFQNGHVTEEVGYLAVYSPAQSGTFEHGGVSLPYTLSQILLDEQWRTVGDQQLQYQEEQSKDTEVDHLLETVDVLQLAGHMFAQDVTSAGGDTAAVRRRGSTPAVAHQSTGGTGTATYFTHTDHLGTVVKATDENGQLVWDADREPFGSLLMRTSGVELPLRFPGQYYDDESGLFYNYFRYYDPATGRYITSDPIGLDGGLNTYAYVGGNPLFWVDPFGLQGIRGGGSRNQGYWRPANAGVTRYGVFGCLVGCASYTSGDAETQASLSPTIGGGLMICSPKPEPDTSCSDDSPPKPEEGCGIYDPNCDNTTNWGMSPPGRMGAIISVNRNQDGTVCINIGPHVGLPGPSVGLGGLSE